MISTSPAECPDLSFLEHVPLPPEVQAHVTSCRACALVVEVFSQDGAPGDCSRFDALLAGHGDGTLNRAGINLLERHLASCEVCRRVANTLSPATDADGDLEALPSVDPSTYALGLEVARGGMGRILAARDLRVGRPVAVKELLGRNPLLAARFEREARVTARLQHPGIVPIYEIGKWPDGTPFYSMRMVDGRTLRDAIAAAPRLSARLVLLPAVIAAAEAVAFAHAQRVIHRDLTPSNVLVGAYGETVVIDWGLAKDLTVGEPDARGEIDGDSVANPSLTNVGAVVGTAMYMPPEQAHGDAVDERADVYALGAILYHVLAGVPPYAGASAAELLREVKAGPPRPVDAIESTAPRDLVSIVEKAMARTPDARYPSARELSEELVRFQTGRMVEAHAYSPRERLLRLVRRHRSAVMVTVLATLLLVTLFAIAVTRVLRSRAEARATAQELLVERGRVELLEGDTHNALAHLAAATHQGIKTPALEFLIGAAVRGVYSSRLLDCGGYAFSVVVSPDGRSVAAACADQAKIWRLPDLTPLATLGPFAGEDFYGLRYGADGSALATWGPSGVARVWDGATGTLRGTFVHGAPITMTTFSPDGARIVTSATDGFARVWDVSSATQVRAIEAATGLVRYIHGLTSVDGTHVLTLSIDGEGKGWDALTGELLGGFSHGSWVLGGDLSEDGKRAITCGVNRLAKVWDATTGAHVVTLAGHTDVVWKCVFDRTGMLALTTGHDGRANVWDLRDGALLRTVEHGDILTSAEFSPDGRRFVTIGIQGRVKVWDSASGALLASLDALRGKNAKFLPDSKGLLVQRGDGRIEVWTDASSQAASFTAPPAASLVAVSRDGTRAASVEAGRVTIWNTESGAAVPTAVALREPIAFAQTAPIAAAAADGGIAIVDVSSGRVRETLPVGAVRDLRVSSAGDRIGIVSDAGTSAVWHRSDGRRIELSGAVGLELSDDGRLAIASVGDSELAVFDTETGARRLEIRAQGFARSLGFGLENQRVVVLETTAALDQPREYVASLRDLETGKELMRERVTSATIDPGGRWLTTIRSGRLVTIWSIEDGRELASFASEQLLSAQADRKRGLIAAVGEYGTSALVLNVTDGRVLARWPIEHAAPTVSQNGFRPPDGTAWWTPDGAHVVSHSRGVAVWHAASPPAGALESAMKHVPWRIVNGRPVLLHDRTLRARIVRAGVPVAGAKVSVEIRIAPDVGLDEIGWDSIRTRYDIRSAVTDGEGSVVVGSLAPGSYRVTVASGTARAQTFDAFVSAAHDDDDEGDEHTFALTPAE